MQRVFHRTFGMHRSASAALAELYEVTAPGPVAVRAAPSLDAARASYVLGQGSNPRPAVRDRGVVVGGGSRGPASAGWGGGEVSCKAAWNT